MTSMTNEQKNHQAYEDVLDRSEPSMLDPLCTRTPNINNYRENAYMKEPSAIELLERISELREQLIYALDYIDAIPNDVVLPAMPSFDRGWVNESLDRSKALLRDHPVAAITNDVRDFLAEFNENQFPQQSTPWISYDDHDPAFLVKELRSFNKQGLIELDHENRRYCLTIKACNTLAVMHAETSSHPAMS